MDKIKSFWAFLTTPKGLTPEAGLTYWQELILQRLLTVASALGVLAWIPSVYLSLKEGLHLVAAADTLVIGHVVCLALNPGFSYAARAAGISLISYIVGLILLFTFGPHGAGPIWIFFFPILTAVLLGFRVSCWALAANGVTVLFVGILIHQNQTEFMARFGFKTWHLVQENPGVKWMVVSANFMLLNTLATASVSMVLTGLKNSLMTLSVSREKYRRIFDNILDVYFETDADGTLVEISPSVEPVYGFSRDQLLGRRITRLFHHPEEWGLFANRLLETHHIQGYELKLKDQTGRAIICSAHTRTIRNHRGEPRFIGIFRDISQQKQMEHRKKELEERLNRSQKMEALGLLAGGVAHDLNNVLSGIVTYPDLLLMDMDGNSPMAEELKTIKASGLRATHIVQDLLALSRRGVVTREVVDFNEILREFLSTPEYDQLISFHPHVTVETDISAETPRLQGSRIHLQKTIMNLISNAAEAQPGGGIIGISTANRRLDTPVNGYDRVLAGDYLVFSIEDYGQGIPPEDLKRIFEPFFTKKMMGRSGTGLGMAVVWGTVQDHDGYIDVISTPGRGTRFDLYFPVTRNPAHRSPGPIRPDRLQGRGETILVVDDDACQRRIATGLLARLNYKVRSAKSGEDAIALLETERTDLILLDMLMPPGIDGLETYRRIKTLCPDQKALVVSGFSKTRQVRETLALGAGGYIKKPYSLEEIGLAVQRELNKTELPVPEKSVPTGVTAPGLTG